MDKYVLNAGNKIRKARKDKSYSTQDLAKILDVSPGLINNIENGKTDTFNLLLLFKISKSLDISVSEIIPYNLPSQIDSSNISNTDVNKFNVILDKLLEFSMTVNWDDTKINLLLNKLIYEINYLSNICK